MIRKNTIYIYSLIFSIILIIATIILFIIHNPGINEKSFRDKFDLLSNDYEEIILYNDNFNINDIPFYIRMSPNITKYENKNAISRYRDITINKTSLFYYQSNKVKFCLKVYQLNLRYCYIQLYHNSNNNNIEVINVYKKIKKLFQPIRVDLREKFICAEKE